MSRVRKADRQALARLARLDPSTDHPLFAAGRWYLRAAQSGPTPDAIVYFWTALEALSMSAPWGTKAAKKERRKFADVALVERAITSTGFDLELLKPHSIGRLADLRAAVVHGGVESPAGLRDGYYVLEAMTRLLLRSRMGIGGVGWPLQPGVPNLPRPLLDLAAMAHRFRKIGWRGVPD